MHANAKRWDTEPVTLTLPDYARGPDATRTKEVVRGSLKQPTADRPCDWCGLPLGVDGIYIHKACIRLERAELMEQARLYRILVPTERAEPHEHH